MPFSTPSTKQQVTKSNVTAGPDARPWDVKLHREVAKTVAKHGGEDSLVFTPTIRELRYALASDPKQFPKKQGKLKDARAADFTFAGGVVWRAVYAIDDARRMVLVLSLGPHDRAYEEAKHRM